jgi:ribosomal protein S18 acetylase RimI-like enzyme
MDSIQTRAGTVADIAALVTLMGAFYSESGHALDLAWAADSFSALLTEPRLGSVALALVDEQPVGYGVMAVKHSMEFGGLIASVEDLFVRLEWRGHGAGSGLLEALLADARARGCLAAQVEVDGGNAVAVGLYEAYGLSRICDGRVVMVGALPVLARLPTTGESLPTRGEEME